MQLTINSETIVCIKMSALEESQDNKKVSALIIDDVKKEIQCNVEDDLKINEEELSDNTSAISNLIKGEAEIVDVKLETQLNGCDVDEIIPNGAPKCNSDINNDTTKVSQIVVEVKKNTENTAKSTKSIVNEMKNQVIMDEIDIENDNVGSETAKKLDFNFVIENEPTVNYTESEATIKQTLDDEKIAHEITDSDCVKKFSDNPFANIKLVHAELVSHSINSMEISAAENTEHNTVATCENSKSFIVTKEIKSVVFEENSNENECDSSQIKVDVNVIVENSSKNEMDKSAMVENNGQLTFQNGTTNIIPRDLNAIESNVSIDEQNNSLESEVQEKGKTSCFKMSETQKETPTDDDKKNNENTNTSEEIADPVVTRVSFNASEDKISSLNDNDKETHCRKVIESETEDKSVVTEENKTENKSNNFFGSDKEKDKFISVVTSTAIERNCEKPTENKTIVDISQKDTKIELIDEASSNLSDEKNNEICVEIKQQNDDGDPDESKAVVEKQVVDNLKDTDCVSLSSMEVDDVEIVATEKIKTEISNNNQDVTMDVSVTDNEDNVIEIFDQDVVELTDNVETENKTEINLDSKKDKPTTKTDEKLDDKVDISDEEEIKIVENTETKSQTPKKEEPSVVSKPLPVVCKLSNTLDILSDEEEEPPSKVSKVEEIKPNQEDKQCINIDDDDDIMLIEDTKETTAKAEKPEKEKPQKTSDEVIDETVKKEASKSVDDTTPKINEKEPIATEIESPKVSEKEPSPPKDTSKPLLPINFLKSAKKNLAEMTRDELEEFCILKIVESIVDRSSLSDIKSKMTTIEKNMQEYKKKAMLLSKQNRDLQVVLKSVQEEQKTRPNHSITPLKITRSVGMQVLMLDKAQKKKPNPQNSNVNASKPITRNMVQPARPQRTPSNQNIPVPRLIPASPAKSTPSSPVTTIAKPPTPNGIRNTVPAQKAAEKRPMTRQATTSSNMTVDLTDDEPPAKVNKSAALTPVRLVPSQNLMAPVRGQMQTNNPRKVFIPINGQGHNLVRGQTAVMLKSVPQSMGPRQRLPSIPRMTSNPVRINLNRHPAPLPDVMKQYQPPTWKALPPAPDLKLAKVENGIVISWKIEDYQEDSYEKIASYQLYAYQETSTPPSTALWKKIGDVKALPLPMACTLTQFMAGFKYYFAVRAVDVKSRLGPFSLPGSILLLNKM